MADPAAAPAHIRPADAPQASACGRQLLSGLIASRPGRWRGLGDPPARAPPHTGVGVPGMSERPGPTAPLPLVSASAAAMPAPDPYLHQSWPLTRGPTVRRSDVGVRRQGLAPWGRGSGRAAGVGVQGQVTTSGRGRLGWGGPWSVVKGWPTGQRPPGVEDRTAAGVGGPGSKGRAPWGRGPGRDGPRAGWDVRGQVTT